MKIDATNYFLRSRGKFRSIPSSWTAALIKAAEKRVEETIDDLDGRSSFRVAYNQRAEVQLGNHRWAINFADVGSTYWTSADGTHLIRVSDHWSHTRAQVTSCVRIRRCYWTLAGKPAVVDGCVGGIIPFSGLEPN